MEESTLVHGNIQSLKRSIISSLEELYNVEFDNTDFIPYTLAEKMAQLTSIINREIAIYINRRGRILDVIVGDHATVSLPEIVERRNQNVLSGVRCIHTHPNGYGELSSLDINSLIALQLDGMIAVGAKDGMCTNIGVGIPSLGRDSTIEKADLYGPFNPNEKDSSMFFKLIDKIDATLRSTGSVPSQDDIEERAILVGVDFSHKASIDNTANALASLDELEELAHTAGAKVLNKTLQRKPSLDPALLIGKGKTEELALLCQSLNANLIIFDEELSGSQIRNLEKATGVTVIDRATLILDIFAQRANSLEGKTQVELAQLKHMLPRLAGNGDELSRLGGGIGTRGPGEKKLEVDKRHIRTRIKFLSEQLEELKKRRSLQRGNRKDIPVVALVGYTNVGKSTLLNKLSGSDVLVENKLFATLDPTARKLVLPDGRSIVLVDTVGFIRKLPHNLIEAFKSTLEEAVYADAIIHVVDASSPDAENHIKVVDKIRQELGATNNPEIMAFNKVDLCPPNATIFQTRETEPHVQISALDGTGLEKLQSLLSEVLFANSFEAEFLIPYHESWAIHYLHQNAKVIREDYVQEGSQLLAEVPTPVYEKLKAFSISAVENNEEGFTC